MKVDLQLRDNAGAGAATARFEVRATGGEGGRRDFVLAVAGDWGAGSMVPDLEPLRRAVAGEEGAAYVVGDATELGLWSSGLVAFLLGCRAVCEERGAEFDTSRLPAGLQRLVGLALVVPTREVGGAGLEKLNVVERVGLKALAWGGTVGDAVEFLGECTLSMWRWVRRRAYFRRSDFGVLLQQCGADALGIVSLISFLVGLILAFVGAVQLERFGASIYVADLVAIAMTREMGCVMVAIVMCGRTGAAFAAQLGTMQVNQEIDAFRVFGISPVDFLVLPRVLALLLMIPLLTLYADLVGIIGGLVVGKVMLGLSFVEYWNETVGALTVLHVGAGVIKSFVFGVIVAITGCWKGLRCGADSASVGLAATSAVVTAISGVIAADALFAVAFNVLGI